MTVDILYHVCFSIANISRKSALIFCCNIVGGAQFVNWAWSRVKVARFVCGDESYHLVFELGNHR